MSTPDSIVFIQSRPGVVRDIRSHCVASFALMVWDSLLMIGDEVEYVWPMPWRMKAKWTYLYLRYVNLAAHLAYLLTVSHLTSGYATEQTCAAWLTFTSVTTLLSHMAVELTLALCAYALFNKSRRIAVLLWVLMGSEFISSILRTVTMPSASLQVGTVCVLISLPKEALIYRLPALFAHTTILGLIFFRSRIAIRLGWGRTPIVSLVVREGIVVYLSAAALFAFVLIGSLLKNERVYAMTFWTMSILSACGCRLVVNLQKIGQHHRDEETSQLFTTNIELE